MCLPTVWHYNPIFKDSDTRKMLEYLPEGEDDAARITLEPGVDINVWKEDDGKKHFVLKWNPVTIGDRLFQNILNGYFKAINDISCSPSPCSIRYNPTNYSTPYTEDKIYDNVKDYLTHLKNEGEKDVNCVSLNLTVDEFKDLYKLHFSKVDRVKIIFSGGFYDHISRLNKNDVKNLITLPQIVRYYAQDKFDRLMIHALMYRKKEHCDDGFIKHFINEKTQILLIFISGMSSITHVIQMI